MDTIQEIFNNREIAIGIWLIIAIPLMFLKPLREFIKTAIPILFSKKFVVFYIVFISYLVAVLYVLNWAGVWNIKLLKDTVFWVMFVELPLFVKAIEKADGHRFFSKLFKENVKVSVVVEFFLGFWTFSLTIEIILIPIIIIVSFLYALAQSEKKYLTAKKFFESLFALAGVAVLINAVYSVISYPDTFFTFDTLKSLLLPLVLLIFNLPIIYGLSLYNMYEQVFIRISGNKKEIRKMKYQVFRFSGISLSKIAAIKKNLPTTIVFCHTSQELKENLNKLTKKLDLQIGDNYMKRSRFYLVACVFGFIISSIGLIYANLDISLKDLVTFNFTFDILRFKEILTYILSSLIVICIVLLIYTIGFNKKQREDITQIKKFALYELLIAVKRQKTQLEEYPSLDEPSKLYDSYVHNAYDIKVSSEKVLSAYENILNTGEKETVELLKSSAIVLSDDFGINEDNSGHYTQLSFCDYYNEKVKEAPQNDKINTFTHSVKTDIEKYSTRVKQFCEDFKYCY